MYDSESCAFTDRAHPAVRGAPVQTLPVLTPQDRSFVALPDDQVDGSRRAGHERDRGRLVALAEDAQRPVAALHGQVFDVGATRLRHP
jgi:hypothetical protein